MPEVESITAKFRTQPVSEIHIVGYFIKASTVHSTEILGDLGFDFVVLDEDACTPSI